MFSRNLGYQFTRNRIRVRRILQRFCGSKLTGVRVQNDRGLPRIFRQRLNSQPYELAEYCGLGRFCQFWVPLPA